MIDDFEESDYSNFIAFYGNLLIIEKSDRIPIMFIAIRISEI